MDINTLNSLSKTYVDMSWEEFGYDDYNQLVGVLVEHNRLYYEDSAPVVSDVEYDMLFSLCKDIESHNPDWIADNSPTQKLTGQLDGGKSAFEKVKHRQPLLSLDNTYNASEVGDRYDGIKRITDKLGLEGVGDFTIEPKYDGISIELIYIDGKFAQGITRGDGVVGEDITKNISSIPGIPANIDTKEELHLRGEIVMPKSHFESINKERSKVGLPLFSNPRNATSGIVKQLQTPVDMQKQLVCYVYDVI